MDFVNNSSNHENEQKDAMLNMIKLGPDQNNIFMSGIGLNQGYSLIATWGGGKSMLLKMELKRLVENHKKSKEPVNIFLVVYETKATNLLLYYKNLVRHMEKIDDIKIHVMNLKDICDLYAVQHENK